MKIFISLYLILDTYIISCMGLEHDRFYDNVFQKYTVTE